MANRRNMLHIFFIAAILSGLLRGGLFLTCPTKQYIERMSNDSVYCDLQARIDRCYWYLGPTTKTVPILKVEDGIKGGVKLEDDHYDITSDCRMRIITAEIKHEATYTYVAILSNGSIWREDISVVITVTPTPFCPSIPMCILCRNCTLEFPINSSGTIVCNIKENRPPISLYWTGLGDNLPISNNKSHYIPNNISRGTWDSTATLEYSLTCGEDISLICHGKAWHKQISTTVRLKSGECDDQLENVEAWNNFCAERSILCWIVPGFGILIIAIVAVIVITMRINHRREQSTAFTNQVLKRDLMKIYSMDLTPELEHLSTSCRVLVKEKNIPIQNIDSEDILTSSFIKDNCRVLFKGKPGVGKSFLFQQLIQKWVNHELVSETIIIYFQLKYLSKNSSILFELMQTLGRTCESTQTLHDILRDHECLIILDGLNDLSEEGTSSDKAEQIVNNLDPILTIDELLKNTYKSTFPKMTLWMSSRIGKVDVEKPFKVVTLLGFSKKQFNTFFEGSCMYYLDKQTKNEKSRHRKEYKCETKKPFLVNIDNKLNIDTILEGFEDDEKISPLVAHVFSHDFCSLTNTLENKFPESPSPFDTSFGKDISAVTLYQEDCYLLAHLFQSSNRNEWKRLQAIKLFEGKDVIVERGKRGYRRQAVITLCMACRDFEIGLKSLTFHQEYPDNLDICIPEIKEELIFNSIRQDWKYLEEFVTKLANKVHTVRFVSCNLPDKVAEEIDEIDKKIFPKVIKEENDQVQSLNIERKIWMKERDIPT